MVKQTNSTILEFSACYDYHTLVKESSVLISSFTAAQLVVVFLFLVMERCEHTSSFVSNSRKHEQKQNFWNHLLHEDLSCMCVCECFKTCRRVRDDFDSMHGSLSTAQNLETVKKFFKPVVGDHRTTLRLLWDRLRDDLWCSGEGFPKRKICVTFVPSNLIDKLPLLILLVPCHGEDYTNILSDFSDWSLPFVA